MRHMIAAALLLLALAAAACEERSRGASGAYIGGGLGGNVARDR
jgi:hypothetical protein